MNRIKQKWREQISKELKEIEMTPNQYQYIKDRIEDAKNEKFKHDRPTSNIKPKEQVEQLEPKPEIEKKKQIKMKQVA